MKRLSSENEDGTLRKEGETGPPRESEPGGWPAWEQQAKEMLASLRTHVYEPDAVGIVALGQALVLRGNRAHSSQALVSFLGVLDAFLSQLIQWAERIEPPNRELRAWAGEKLAERFLFLLAQSDQWHASNEGFKKKMAQFPDRRQSRSPLSFVSWLAGDYLNKLLAERRNADLILAPLHALGGSSFAREAALPEDRISLLGKLRVMPEFSPDSAEEWAEVVYEAMEQDQEHILALPRMLGCSSRDSRNEDGDRRGSSEFKFYDLKPTIVGAVKALADKQGGTLRGITRPIS